MKLILAILTFVASGHLLAEELAVIAPEVSAQQTASAATMKVTSAMKESEIPVHLEQSKKVSNSDSPIMRMLLMTVIVGTLFGGSVLYVKRMKKTKVGKEQAPDIKVLTQHFLGPKKSLAIIRVAGESMLIGVTDQNINLIKSLSLLDEEIPGNVPSNFNTTMDQQMENQEDFSISGIKDVVTNRLKNMRSFQ